jgi:hypothetical protein
LPSPPGSFAVARDKWRRLLCKLTRLDQAEALADGFEGMTSYDRARLEEIGFGCILAVLGALALTKPNITPNTAILYWLVFVVLTGVSIDPEAFDSVRDLAAYCSIPSGALIVTLIFRGALSFIAGAAFITVASISPMPADTGSIIKLAILYLFIFFATVPGILAGCFSRRILHQIVSGVWNAKTAKVKTLEKNIIIGLRIVSLLFGALLAFG